MAIQRLKITFEVLTRADAPLRISPSEEAALLEAFEEAVSMHVDLRYNNGDCHKLLGADMVVSG